MFKHIRDANIKYGRSLFSDGRFETLWRVFEAMVWDERWESVTYVLDGLVECIEEFLDPLWIKLRHIFTPGNPTLAKKSPVQLRVFVELLPLSVPYRSKRLEQH
jgi:hypothetical protein